jgi:hypothetical protein
MRILYADMGLRRLEGYYASSGVALSAAPLGHKVILGHRNILQALSKRPAQRLSFGLADELHCYC